MPDTWANCSIQAWVTSFGIGSTFANTKAVSAGTWSSGPTLADDDSDNMPAPGAPGFST